MLARVASKRKRGRFASAWAGPLHSSVEVKRTKRTCEAFTLHSPPHSNSHYVCIVADVRGASRLHLFRPTLSRIGDHQLALSPRHSCRARFRHVVTQRIYRQEALEQSHRKCSCRTPSRCSTARPLFGSSCALLSRAKLRRGSTIHRVQSRSSDQEVGRRAGLGGAKETPRPQGTRYRGWYSSHQLRSTGQQLNGISQTNPACWKDIWPASQ